MKKQKKTQVATTSEPKKSVSTFSPEKTRRMIMNIARFEGDLDKDIEKLGEDIFPRFFDGEGKEKKEARKELDKITRNVLFALEVDTHGALMASFDQPFRGMAKELSKQIIIEYNCKTHAEKMLVEIIVNGFIRTIENSNRFNNTMNAGEYITPNRTNYLAMLSKQIDRSQRQYLSALMTLKQLKAPTIEMTIKANTAFIAQNQQNNANQPNHEIIDSK
jgi:hypothetical protein